MSRNGKSVETEWSPGAGGRGLWEVTADGYRFCNDGGVLELDGGDGCIL